MREGNSWEWEVWERGRVLRAAAQVVTEQVLKILFILHCGVWGRFNLIPAFRPGAVWTRPILGGDIRGPAELIPIVPPFPGDGISFYWREKYTWSEAHSFRSS